VVSTAAMNTSGSVLAGRSLTWPSPTSTTRHAPSERRTRSTVMNGSPSEPTGAVIAARPRPAAAARRAYQDAR
jgi:hypothetical protein